MKNRFVKILTMATALGIAAVTVTGCAGGSGPQSAAKGGDVTFLRVGDASTLMPTEAAGNNSIWVVEQMFDTLLAPSTDGKKMEPNLATSYKQSADKLTWTFDLRHDAKFSDGKPLTSKDVVFSLKKASDPELPFGFINEGITSITAAGPYQVDVTTKTPWAPLPSSMGLFANAIIPDNYGGVSEKQFEKHPIGSGPFQLQKWDKSQQSIKLVRNKHYWKPGRPYLDSVTFKSVTDDNTRLMQVKGGQAQIDESPALSSLDSLKNDSSVQVQKFESSETDYLIMNTQRAPLNDQHVRAAIAHAIDKKSIIQAALSGYGTPANSFLAPAIWGYDKNQKAREFDLSAARKELSESSTPNGFTTELEVVGGDQTQEATAQIIQADLKKIGITANIVQKDDDSAGNDRVKGNYDLAFTYSTTDITDPEELVNFVGITNGGAINAMHTWFDDPQIDEWAKEAAASTDPDTRLKLYSQIQTRHNEAQPLVPLYYTPSYYVTSKKLHNFTISTVGQYGLTDAWLQK